MDVIPELPDTMQSIISELSGSMCVPDATEESQDSMDTQAPNLCRLPKFSDSIPHNQTEEISVLVLMMNQLLECVAIAPMKSVHICVTQCATRLDSLSHLIYIKNERRVTTEEVVKVLLLHQSIKGLVKTCPHTFIVAELEDYIKGTQNIIDSLYGRFKMQIVDESSSKKSMVTCVKWMENNQIR